MGGSRLTWLLQSLRKEGHDLTLVVREDVDHARYQSFFSELGIRIFAGDKERLVPLGIESVEARRWTFGEVFLGKNFDAAFLIQSFHRGISVPEQYLDDIRRVSPHTRIAVICPDARTLER